MFQFAVLLLTLACALAATVPDGMLSQLDGRIVGGEATNIVEVPYQCSFQMNSRHMCGCAIIGKRTIVTAGHCIISGVPANWYNVRVGSTFKNSGGVLHTVESVTRHPNYNSNTIENDIAVVKLETEVTYNSETQSISLSRLAPNDDTAVIVSGWGTTKAGASTSPDELRSTTVYILSKKTCESELYNYGSRVKKCMICATDFGKDSCQGDSGGPMATNSGRNGRTLVGVVSWGIGCAQSGYPGAYTDVACFSDWLDSFNDE